MVKKVFFIKYTSYTQFLNCVIHGLNACLFDNEKKPNTLILTIHCFCVLNAVKNCNYRVFVQLRMTICSRRP